MSTSSGYPVVYHPRHPRAWSTGYVFAHRAAAEEMIGRYLKKKEHVHHKDHDRSNFAHDNLEILSPVDHARLHGDTMKIRIEYTCANCGIIFIRKNSQRPESKGTANTFCSRRCNGMFNGFKQRAT